MTIFITDNYKQHSFFNITIPVSVFKTGISFRVYNDAILDILDRKDVYDITSLKYLNDTTISFEIYRVFGNPVYDSGNYIYVIGII